VSSLSDFAFVADYFDVSVHRSVDDRIAYVIWTDRRDKTSIFDLEDDVAMDKITLSNSACISGTEKNDALIGTSRDDCMDGKGGNDKLISLAGGK
jgi:hypothetical protein